LDYTHDGSGNSTVYLPYFRKAKRILSFREILSGFIPFIGALLVAGSLTFSVGKDYVYPQYNDLLNGFTYGHAYIAAFVLLSLAICFLFYNRFSAKKVTMNHYVAPMFCGY
jgi:hypothetical protein